MSTKSIRNYLAVIFIATVLATMASFNSAHAESMPKGMNFQANRYDVVVGNFVIKELTGDLKTYDGRDCVSQVVVFDQQATIFAEWGARREAYAGTDKETVEKIKNDEQKKGCNGRGAVVEEIHYPTERSILLERQFEFVQYTGETRIWVDAGNTISGDILIYKLFLAGSWPTMQQVTLMKEGAWVYSRWGMTVARGDTRDKWCKPQLPCTSRTEYPPVTSAIVDR